MRYGSGILLSCLIIAFSWGCDDDDLPEPTQEGADMLAAKIDGDNWEADALPTDIKAVEGSYTTSSNTLIITGRRVDQNNNQILEIALREIQGEGDYTIDLKAPSEAYYEDRKEETRYNTTTQHGGDLELTYFNTELGIAAGTFSFQALNEDNEEIEITEGRFDINIRVN